VHRRKPRLALRSFIHAYEFVKDSGFCFTSKAEDSALPSLWHAVSGERAPRIPRYSQPDPYRSIARELQDLLIADGKIYFGRLLRRRPTMISMEFLPFFYVLAGRTGIKDDYVQAFVRGDLSDVAKEIMDELADGPAQVTQGLKAATGNTSKSYDTKFARAILELQVKMFILRVAEHRDPFMPGWATVDTTFPTQVKKAAKISIQEARKKILQKYFHNQLVGSVQAIYHLFRWNKQVIYQTLGHLVHEGIISGNVKVQGMGGTYYSLIDRN
jgi:hypothetical protein